MHNVHAMLVIYVVTTLRQTSMHNVCAMLTFYVVTTSKNTVSTSAFPHYSMPIYMAHAAPCSLRLGAKPGRSMPALWPGQLKPCSAGCSVWPYRRDQPKRMRGTDFKSILPQFLQAASPHACLTRKEYFTAPNVFRNTAIRNKR